MGEADADKDQIVTAAELISYLQGHVEAATDRQQHVRDFGDFEPDAPLAFTDKAAPKGVTLDNLPAIRGSLRDDTDRTAGERSHQNGLQTGS